MDISSCTGTMRSLKISTAVASQTKSSSSEENKTEWIYTHLLGAINSSIAYTFVLRTMRGRKRHARITSCTVSRTAYRIILHGYRSIYVKTQR